MTTQTKPAAPAARKTKPVAKRVVTATPAPAQRKTKPAPASVAAAPAAGTKQSQLIALLRSPHGTSIEQMTATTGWQPHTVRGTISGVLRKKLGLNVACTAQGDGSRLHRIVASAE